MHALQIVAVRLADTRITEFETCVIAAHFMANRIVLPVLDVAEGDHAPEEVEYARQTLGAPCQSPGAARGQVQCHMMRA